VPIETGVREVPQGRREVWQALAVLSPYCAVCDVSYVVQGKGAGTTFVCVPGHLDGRDPGPEAARGEIVEWRPRRLVATRLDLPAEVWTTRIELEDADGGGTRITMAVGCEPRGGNRLAGRLQARARQRLVRQTLDAELEKVPAHITQAVGNA
jgi:hypothetical protein